MLNTRLNDDHERCDDLVVVFLLGIDHLLQGGLRNGFLNDWILQQAEEHLDAREDAALGARLAKDDIEQMVDGFAVFERLEEWIWQALSVFGVILAVAAGELNYFSQKLCDAAVLARVLWALEDVDHLADEALLVHPLEEAALHLGVFDVVEHVEHQVDDDGHREVLGHGVEKVVLRLDELEHVKTNRLVQEPVSLHLLDDEGAECLADEGREERVQRRLLLEEAVQLVHDVGVLDEALLERRHVAGDDLTGHIGVEKALVLGELLRRLCRDECDKLVDDFGAVEAERRTTRSD